MYFRSNFRIISFAIVSFFFLGSASAEDSLTQAVGVAENTNAAAATSQKKIDTLSEETQKMLQEYHDTIRETDTLTVYNEQMQALIKAQESEKATVQFKLDSIEETERSILPLMVKMIDSLEEFVNADLPFNQGERLVRVQQLREEMEKPAISIPGKYQKIVELYQQELNYGRTLDAYESFIGEGATQRQVDILRVGRAALYYQTVDGEETAIWNQNEQKWDVLPSKYNKGVLNAIRVASKKQSPELLKLAMPKPIERVESASLPAYINSKEDAAEAAAAEAAAAEVEATESEAVVQEGAE